MQDVSAQLRTAIERDGFSQDEIATMCGVSQPTIYRLLNTGIKRTGPAYRRVLQALENGALSKDEYSSLSKSRDRMNAKVDRLVAEDDVKAKALDNLLQAIELYASVIGERK